MRKDDYLSQLRSELFSMPIEDRENAISFYEELFDEAGENNYSSVISDLGTPIELARAILCDNSDYSRSIKMETKSQKLFVENCRVEKAVDEGYANFNIGFSKEYKTAEPVNNFEFKVAKDVEEDSHNFVNLSKDKLDNSANYSDNGIPVSHGDSVNTSNSTRTNVNYSSPQNLPASSGPQLDSSAGNMIGWLFGVVFILPFVLAAGITLAIGVVIALVMALMLGILAVCSVISAPLLLIASIPAFLGGGFGAGIATLGGALIMGGIGILLIVAFKNLFQKGIPAIVGEIDKIYKKIRSFFDKKGGFL